MALFYDPTEKSFTLDKLDTGFQFELRSTPGQVYALGIHSGAIDGLGIGDGEQEDLFGGESGGDDEDTTPDLNNPYDYRHYLNKGTRSPSPAPSHAASPVPQSITFNSSPVLPAVKPSRPPKAKPSPSRPSRPKQRTQEKPRYLSPKPRQEELDADNEDSDPDELVIDMGDSPPTNNTATNSRPWRSALSVLNEGGRSSAPFSLRSAASSMSPSLRGGSPSDEDEVDEDDDEKELEVAEDDDQSDAAADDDDDIEEIDLGITNSTPDPSQNAAAQPPPPEEAVTPSNGWDADDDDELEAELALALEEDQAKSDIEEAARATTSVNDAASLVAAANGGGESSEESEEE